MTDEFASQPDFQSNFVNSLIRGEAFNAAHKVIEEALDNVEKVAWEKETLKNIPEFNVLKLVQTVSEVAHF